MKLHTHSRRAHGLALASKMKRKITLHAALTQKAAVSQIRPKQREFMFYLLGSERFVPAMKNGCPCNRPVLRLLSRFISSTQPPSAPALPLRLLQQALRRRGRVINFVSQHCGVCSSFLDKRDLTLHIANVVAHGPLFIDAVQSLFFRKFWPF